MLLCGFNGIAFLTSLTLIRRGLPENTLFLAELRRRFLLIDTQRKWVFVVSSFYNLSRERLCTQWTFLLWLRLFVWTPDPVIWTRWFVFWVSIRKTCVLATPCPNSECVLCGRVRKMNILSDDHWKDWVHCVPDHLLSGARIIDWNLPVTELSEWMDVKDHRTWRMFEPSHLLRNEEKNHSDFAVTIVCAFLSQKQKRYV